ncbi:hypothetical protein BST99_12260 [Aureicoccus marinus]|uniref:Uncharacterized protein n=2 Tax=Aureicoccus marinus TaxID=754435 RepID=A0A2S7TA66_9FLAO|nr:hypothetical protein BST99_12260 [Aureicoccus marinus]
MEAPEYKHKMKVIVASLMGVILLILILFYWSFAQSRIKIDELETDKELLTREMATVKSEIDRLSGLNEITTIDLQDARYQIEKLEDSIGQLNFTVANLKYNTIRLRALSKRFDSIRKRNEFLVARNNQLARANNRFKSANDQLKRINAERIAAESSLQEKTQDSFEEQGMIPVNGVYLSAFYQSGSRFRSTRKSRQVELLRVCVDWTADESLNSSFSKSIYYKITGPNNQLIQDGTEIVRLGDFVYSAKFSVRYNGKPGEGCDDIQVSRNSLSSGSYVLTLFDDNQEVGSATLRLE